MLIYNVTIKVDWAIHEAWLDWIKNIHIPEIIRTKCFTHAIILRLLETDEAEGPTYAVQYFASHKEAYQEYIEKFAHSLREKSYKEWGDQFIAFRTLMEVVQ